MITCRTFDVNDTGRISESKFRQILATKQVPKDDVEGILQGVEMKKAKLDPVGSTVRYKMMKLCAGSV